MQTYKVKTYETREQWLNARGFGGSSASAILDLNPYQTKVDLLINYFTPITTDNKTSNQIYGTTMEPYIREMFAIDFQDKYEVREPNGFEMYIDKEHEFLTATVDGILIDKKTNKKGILEIKTHDVLSARDLDNWNDHLPDNYYIQCLHYMMVLNDSEFCILVAKLRFFESSSSDQNDERKISKQEIRYYYIDKQEKIKEIKYLKTKEIEFYKNYIIPRKIPSFKI